MSIIEKRKQKKMNLVFTTVRENPDYTKTEIKASTGLSMESVIQYVDTLVQDNCLYYSGSRGANVGRKGDSLRGHLRRRCMGYIHLQTQACRSASDRRRSHDSRGGQ